MITWLILGVAQAIYITCPINNPRGGKYDQQTHQITICQNFAEGEYVANHEFWHWVWFERMTYQERERFNRIKDDSCVTTYACTSKEEDFAENVRHILNNKPSTPKQFYARSILYKYNIK